jgi:hypothetical protein
MIDFAKNNDLSIQANYEVVESYLDIENFIDYNILYIFLAIIDWPANNFEHWNALGEGIKIRHLAFDGDSGFIEEERDMIAHALQDSVEGIWPNGAEFTMLFRRLMDNPDFRSGFVTRYGELLSSTFRTKNLHDLVYQESRKYVDEIDRHGKRFPFPPNFGHWQFNMGLLEKFVDERPCIAERHIRDHFPDEELLFDCGINSLEEEGENMVFPNPATEFVKVDRPEKLKGHSVEISVYSADGKLMYSNSLTDRNSPVKVHISEFAVGVYIIELTGPDGDRYHYSFIKL